MIGGANDGCSSCPPCTPPCSPSDICVRLNGGLLGVVDSLRVRGYDLTNDGKVGVSDLVPFGTSYNKNLGQAGFNPCCDYNGDDKCSLTDLSYWGMHNGHAHDDGSTYYTSRRSLPSGMDMVLRRESGSTQIVSGTVRITVCLERAFNLSAAAIGLDIRESSLRFLGWETSGDFGGTVMVTPLIDDTGMILIGIVDMEGITSNSVQIGTLVFSADDGAADTTPESMRLAFGEVLDTKGRIMSVGSFAVEEGEPGLRNLLSANHPNPFNPSTTIEYSIADDSPVSMAIYNINGQLIRTLVREFQRNGTYSVIWDGKNSDGRSVESGVYFCRIVAGSFKQSKKLILLR
jgi:hypothetical protein